MGAVVLGLLAAPLGCGRAHHAVSPLEPQYGTLAVDSDPPGATILVDGRGYASTTPDDFTLVEGPHRVEVLLPGHTYTPASTTLAVPANGTVSYTFLEYAPRLVASSSAHDFGPQGLGTSSPAWCFSVTNAGRAVSDSGAFALAGADADQFAILSGGTWRDLAPGASQQVCVAFRPTRLATRRATIAVGGSPVALSGSGVKVPCDLASDAASHDFGTQEVGQAYGSWCFTITNHDASTCSDTLRLGGADPGEFTIVSGAIVDLAPGASQAVCVAFHPIGAGARAATIAVGTGAVSVSGTGSGRCAIGAPQAPDGTAFGAVCTDETPTRRLVVANSGNPACTVSATGCAAFPVTPASASVPPGGSATFTVSFEPQQPGPAPDCDVTLTDGTSTWPTTFTGTGIAPAIADFSPSGGIVAHAGDGVTFVPQVQANGSAVTAYAWDFGDGTTSTQASPTHRFANGGTYTVTLTVTNACGASPVAAHTVCIDEPAYVLLYHFDTSVTPDYTTNIPGWGTAVPLVLYRGTNAGWSALPSVVCANMVNGEMIKCGRAPSGSPNLGGAETLGIPGQSFASANLPLPPQECSVTVDLTLGAPSAQTTGPIVYTKVGGCAHTQIGRVIGDNLYCHDYFSTSHCATLGGDGRVEWGLEAQAIPMWTTVNAVRLTFNCWYVCPGEGPQTGPLRVVEARTP